MKGTPNGEYFSRVEQPRGEVIHYVKGNGSKFLQRFRVRVPTFTNIPAMIKIAFTRAIAEHMLKNYDGVLRVGGKVGKKKNYDHRSYLASAEASMAERVKEAVRDLRGEGTTLLKG